MILPSTYIGNIFYWHLISSGKNVCIDEGEYFIKQTFRNRAEISTEKGRTDLIIPLEKGKNSKQAMHEVCISYAENWRALHFKTICSAYGKAAYFEHYKHELENLFSQQPKHLCEWNKLWFDFMANEFEIDTSEIFRSYIYKEEKNMDEDFRLKMDPKIEINFQHQEYYNLFFDKFPQPKNLCVLDLLLNEGPRGVRVFSF